MDDATRRLEAVSPRTETPDTKPQTEDASWTRTQTIASHVGPERDVLVIGADDIQLIRALLSRGCGITAVERDRRTAARVGGLCQRVVVADPADLGEIRELHDDTFDVIVIGSQLERARDPVALLRNVRGHLTDSGYVVASVRNVAHGDIRLSLLTGQFPWGPSEAGASDPAHFFTQASITSIFEKAGLPLLDVETIDQPVGSTDVPYDREKLSAEFVKQVANEPGAQALFFVVTAAPDPESEVAPHPSRNNLADEIRELRSSMDDGFRNLHGRIEWIARQADETRRRLDMLEERRPVESAVDNRADGPASTPSAEEELRNMLLEAHNDVLRRDEELLELRETFAARESELTSQLEQVARDREEAGARRDELAAQLAEVARHRDELAADLAGLSETTEEQQGRIAELEQQLNHVSELEAELRSQLLEAHQQLLQRDEEIQQTLAEAIAAHRPGEKETPEDDVVPSKHLRYQHIIKALRDVVGRVVPPGAVVAVVSKGDDELLRFDDRVGRHFPHDERGVYLGYHPRSSEDAIGYLRAAIAGGSQYLLIPKTAFWWLDHYEAFRELLDTRHRLVASEEDVCRIYELTDSEERHGEPDASPPSDVDSYEGLVDAIRAVVERTIPVGSIVLVLSKGGDELVSFDSHRGWHFPQTEGGIYAGGYPQDAAHAIAHLEALRQRGAEYLVIPKTAFWWLVYYEEFWTHLERKCRRIVKDDNVLIYGLSKRRRLWRRAKASTKKG